MLLKARNAQDTLAEKSQIKINMLKKLKTWISYSYLIILSFYGDCCKSGIVTGTLSNIISLIPLG